MLDIFILKVLKKKEVLENEFNVKMIDLEINCPSLSVLKEQNSSIIDCTFMDNSATCVVYHIFLFSKWVLQYLTGDFLNTIVVKLKELNLGIVRNDTFFIIR